MIFLKIIIFTVCLYFSRSYTLELKNTTNECSGYVTCETCAANTHCNWFLEHQKCVNVSQTPEGLMVNSKANCPRYSVENNSVFLVQQNYTYKVMVSNDVYGFMNFLSGSTIECKFIELMLNTIYTFKGRVRDNTITCEPINFRNISTLRYFRQKSLFVIQCVVTINSVTVLRLDNLTANYLSVHSYSREGDVLMANDTRCEGLKKDDGCVTCAWNDKDYWNFFKRCLNTSPCVGMFGIYTRIYAQNYTRVTMPTAAVVALTCPSQLDVVAVAPTQARWRGQTSVSVVVRNHGIMNTGSNFRVFVAGRRCMGQRSVGGDAINCTVSGPAADFDRLPDVGGPVDVYYVFNRTYKLTSAERFRWIYPEATGVGPACGPLGGGTVLTINGSLLASGDAVRVSVGANRTCDVTSRSDDRIVCRTGRADAAAGGGVTMTFDGNLTRHIRNASFEYVDGGPALDARQQFEAIVSGGTSLPVRGTRFRCAENPRVYVDHSGVRNEAGCRVKNDSYMVCRSPRLDAGTQGAAKSSSTADFGFLVDFGGEPLQLPARPDFPRYSIFPDPQFFGFETVNGTVVLYGRDLGSGYRPDDVSVRFENSTDVCAVTLMTRDRIECEPTTTDGPKESGRVFITVGDFYSNTLRKSLIIDESIARDSSYYVNYMIYAGIIIVILVITLVVYISFLRFKSNRQYHVYSEQLLNL